MERQSGIYCRARRNTELSAPPDGQNSAGYVWNTGVIHLSPDERYFAAGHGGNTGVVRLSPDRWYFAAGYRGNIGLSVSLQTDSTSLQNMDGTCDCPSLSRQTVLYCRIRWEHGSFPSLSGQMDEISWPASRIGPNTCDYATSNHRTRRVPGVWEA